MSAQREVMLSGADISQHEIDAVVSVMKSPWLSLGPKIPEFEKCFTDRLGVRHGIACNSGTSALHMCWRALGVGPGDEVITTPFSFIASSNSIMFEGAKPVFVDIDPRTWQIDPSRVEAAITSRTKAMLPVDVFGSIPDMDAINTIAKRRGLRVIEDSCEALGSTYKGRPAGTLAEAGVFGFYPNKQITTGEGGMITTSDDKIAFMTRSYRNQGRDPDAGWLAHARLGFNFRLTDIQAAIGVEQMRRLDEITAKRTRVANLYLQRLEGERRITTMHVPGDVNMNWFVFVVRLNDDYSKSQRDAIQAKLKSAGIHTNNYFTPIHLQPFYGEQWGYKAGDFPITEALAARTIALPFHNKLTEVDIDYVVGEFRKAL